MAPRGDALSRILTREKKDFPRCAPNTVFLAAATLCFCLFFLCGFLKDDRKCLLFHLSGFFSVGGPAFFLQFNSLFGPDESNKTPSTM